MELYRAYFRLPAVHIAGLFYFLIAGALTQVPLFNYLGYEFSASMTIPASFCAGMVTISVAREHLTKPLSARTWVFITADYLIVNTLLLAIPFVVMSANALAVKNCSFSAGVAYYMLLPWITMVFCVVLAMVVALNFRHARTVFTFVVAAVLSHIAIVTYCLPQLFAYNPILGYFPGITYDEVLNDLSTLVLYREFTLVGALLLWIIFFMQISYNNNTGRSIGEHLRLRPHSVLFVAACVCALIIGSGYVFRDRLGFEYSRAEIQECIGRRTESDHFIFYYAEQNATSAQAKALKAKAEFQYYQVVQRMGTKEPHGEKISVYLYPDAVTKQRLTGAAATNVAKPWLHEIHMLFDAFDDVFRHELVHALASDFGSPVIHASIRMGMNEGLAVAIDWNEGLFTPHEYAAAMLRDSLLGDVESLFHITGFATQQSTYAYLVAGSFSKYLIDLYGMERFKIVFRNGNFVGVYAQPLSVCIGQWKKFLASIPCTMLPPETVAHLFMQPSIFRKTCARVTAEKNRRGLAFLREKKYAEAEAEFASSAMDAKTPFAFRGWFSALLLQQKSATVLAAYDDLGKSSALRFNPSLLLLTGDALMQEGGNRRAANFYRCVENMHYSDAFIEAAALRRLASADTALVQVFLASTYGGMNDSTRQEYLAARHVAMLGTPGVGVVAYWRGIEYRKVGNWSAAAVMFQKAAYALNDTMATYEASLTAGDAFFETGLYEQALAMLWYANNYVFFSKQYKQLREKSDLYAFVQRRVQE